MTEQRPENRAEDFVRSGYTATERKVARLLTASLPETAEVHTNMSLSGREFDILVIWPGVGVIVFEIKGLAKHTPFERALDLLQRAGHQAAALRRAAHEALPPEVGRATAFIVVNCSLRGLNVATSEHRVLGLDDLTRPDLVDLFRAALAVDTAPPVKAVTDIGPCWRAPVDSSALHLAERLPLPLAGAYRRYLLAHDPQHRFEAAMYLTRYATTVAAAVAAAWAATQPTGSKARHVYDRNGSPTSTCARRVLARRPMYGTRLKWTQSLVEAAHEDGEVMLGLRDAFLGEAGLLATLAPFVQLRNDHAHDRIDIKHGPDLLHSLEQIERDLSPLVASLSRLGDVPWVLVAKLDFDAQTEAFLVQGDDFTGANADLVPLPSMRRGYPVSTGDLWLLGADAGVNLTPWIWARNCSSCGQRTWCYPEDEQHAEGLELLTFGHPHAQLSAPPPGW